MSASLVGSEMCIRDRAKTGSSSVCMVSRGQLCMVVRAERASMDMLMVKAVSYRHLTLPTICSV
eukprot:10218552-Alexandrium_andersonii.AAC.1